MANPDKGDKYLHEIRFKKEETNFVKVLIIDVSNSSIFL